MRKLIATGLGALTLASGFAMAAATPASAAPLVPVICAALPANLVSANASLTVASSGAASASATMATKTTALNSSLLAYVQSVSDWLIAGDSGVGVATAKSIMDARFGDLAGKVADGSASRAAWFAADTALQGAQQTVTVINALLSDLSCGA